MSVIGLSNYEEVPDVTHKHNCIRWYAEGERFSLKGIGILLAGVVLGATIGLVVASNSAATDAPEVSVPGMAFDDFIRLNTTSFNGLAPVVSAGVVESVSVDPGFLEINTTSFNGLAPAVSAAVDPGFLERNIASLEYPARDRAEPSSGLR